MEKEKLIELLKDAWNDGMSQYHDCKHHSQYETDLENWIDSVEDEINKLCVAEESSNERAALPLADVSCWLDVDTEMPKPMEFVLFCELTNHGLIGGSTQTFHIGWFDEINQWFSECAGWMDDKTITHWMRLPSPPACS